MDSSSTKTILDYLRKALQLKASDLHLCVGAPPAARVDGAIVAIEDGNLSADEARDLIFASMTEKQRGQLQENWEIDFAFQIEGLGRFRGNVHFSRGEIEAVYRHIPKKVPDLTLLGHYPVVEELCNERRGLILVTGITGCGKTTTLASMVRRITQKRQAVVISIEDPIEYKFTHSKSLVKQRELGHDTKSFGSALRQAMRQDPDVIVVSELRDLETIQTALTAAETGHLVLAGLHTLDAPQSIDRLIDVFPSIQQQQVASQLGNVLNCIISQRLLPRYNARGRVLATEILRNNYAVRNCIRDRKIQQIVGLIEIGRAQGMHTIDDCLLNLYKRQLISKEEVLGNARDADFLESEN